eukprot:30938-Pelagococcus_subviridis.AAC.7
MKRGSSADSGTSASHHGIAPRGFCENVNVSSRLARRDMFGASTLLSKFLATFKTTSLCSSAMSSGSDVILFRSASSVWMSAHDVAAETSSILFSLARSLVNPRGNSGSARTSFDEISRTLNETHSRNDTIGDVILFRPSSSV